jgi:ribosomal protein L28
MQSRAASVRKSTYLIYGRSNRLKRINKIKRYMYSEILHSKLYVRMSKKAYRCIRKLGSFDRYILLTKPKDLDSKIGEYYREIMLRKINDP